MEMLMARAEQERSGLERELRAMRCTASEAAQHLHAAEEELQVSPAPVASSAKQAWCILGGQAASSGLPLRIAACSR